MVPLLGLGEHMFEILPLTLQKIEEETRANHPEIGRFGAGPNRQFTGPGGGTLKIEGLCFNEEFGGYEDYLALKVTARSGSVLDLMGWGAGAAYGLVIGPVVMLKVGAVHEMLGPDGIGRKITFSIECGEAGTGAAGGLLG